jgi:cell division protein FtsB
MKGADSTVPGAAAQGKKIFFTAGLIFCLAALLCLSAFSLHSVYISQKAVSALREQMDELRRTSALSQKERDAEILALQVRIDELLTGLAQSVKAQEERETEIEALQKRIDELSQRTGPAFVATLPGTDVPLASITAMDSKDEETPLTLVAEIPDEPAKTAATAQAGQAIAVTVYAPEIKDMYGYELKVYFDSEEMKYSGGLQSGITSITTIFSKEFEHYVLIGATMVGKKEGYTTEAAKTEICSLTFTALKDCDLSELSIGGVNIVGSGLEYVENIENWEITASL